ncbi:restriction endonuclease subunit S [Aeromonas dhakensis]|uniref:restriction endonuclease subunit S n=1 Tax=Aeromonas dhakensis TaxID=196024 RepID=UPI002157A246|nr:restriction endonuclease subunit S [Aeromonas dhakensis]MCR6737425.1 restriction endonuclease subunit S [Aeromonas dhakensis]
MAALKIENLITDHLDLWTAAVRPKSSAGRGSNSKLELTGIKKLRELILELAVRGKLVPQDPSDEPASVLLERIVAAKAQLVKDKKIKKEKPLPAVSDDEKKFELPIGWEWIRLQSVTSKITDGDHKTPSRIDCGMRMLSAKNVRDGFVDFTNCDFISNDDYLKSRERCLPETGDLMIVSVGGTIGRSSLVPEDSEFSIVRSVALIKPLHINGYYLKYLSDSPLLQNSIHEKKRGGAQPCLYLSEICKFPLPLPPIQEQARIVAKVDELMAICDQLEQQSEAQLAAHQTLVDALLATLTDSTDADELAQNWTRLSSHFGTLFTTEASIDALKQTILQLAVMGKLVPQDPSDEPASALLDRIAAEKAQLVKEKKIKKEKPLPAISEDEKPFELPQGWAWVRLGTLCGLITSGSRGWNQYYSDIGSIFIRSQDIKFDSLLFDDRAYVNLPNGTEGTRTRVEFGDMLMTITGANVAKVAIVSECFDDAYVSQHVALIRLVDNSLNKFIHVWLTCNGGGRKLLLDLSYGAKPGLNLNNINEVLVPLAPQNMQKTILERVNELMFICERLKSRLGTSQQTQLALAESLVEGALA